MQKKTNKKTKQSLLPCAFCRGTGLDRFGVPSKLSRCQACQGRGEVSVPEPHEKCPSCLGSGVYRHHRLTCSVCGGKGRVSKINRARGEGCEKESAEALDIETGLPCISAYDLGRAETMPFKPSRQVKRSKHYRNINRSFNN